MRFKTQLFLSGLFIITLIAGIFISGNNNAINITFFENEITVYEGEEITLAADIKPKNASVIWESDDICIAYVNEGKVTAVKEGNATITAKSGKFIKKQCKINVIKKDELS